jgi:hypothetical protein
MTITAPGVYDIDEATYHRDPPVAHSLSSTELRRIGDSPARFHHYRTTRQEDYSAEFDVGHAAHKLVLGKGALIVAVEADDWRTKDARAQRDEARASGHVPLLTADYEQVQAMARALRLHPLASKLIDHDHGQAEASVFWQETETVWGRARFDWLPDPTGRRRIICDYKTSVSADPATFGKSVANYGYHQQHDVHRGGCAAVFPDEPAPGFVFIVQEKRPPYLVSVIELDPYAKEIGKTLNDRAVTLYERCVDTGEWPGYAEQIHQVTLPRWAEIDYEENAA